MSLHKGAKKNNIALVRQLIAEGADVNVVDKVGATPLRWSTWRGFVEVSRALLEAKADVDKPSPIVGTSPLAGASNNGFVDCVRVRRQLIWRGHSLRFKKGSP